MFAKIKKNEHVTISDIHKHATECLDVEQPYSPKGRGLFDLIISCRLILRVIIYFTWIIPKTTVSFPNSGGGCWGLP
jgi:hypothetical protein